MTEADIHIFPASLAELDAMERAAAAVGAEDVRAITAAIRDSWPAREHGRHVLAASPLDRNGNWYAPDGSKLLFDELLPPGTRVPAAELARMMPCAQSRHIDESRTTLSINDALLCTCPRCGKKHLVIECRGKPAQRGPYIKWRILLCAQEHGVEAVPLRYQHRYGTWEEMRTDDSPRKGVPLEERSSRR